MTDFCPKKLAANMYGRLFGYGRLLFLRKIWGMVDYSGTFDYSELQSTMNYVPNVHWTTVQTFITKTELHFIYGYVFYRVTECRSAHDICWKHSETWTAYINRLPYHTRLNDACIQ